MANDYCSSTDVIDILTDGQPDTWNTAYNDNLTRLITAASRAIDSFLKRKPGAFCCTSDETYYYTGSGGLQLWIDELAASPTSVYVAETGDLSNYTAWGDTDFFLYPDNAISDGIPYTRIDIDNLYGSKTYWPEYRKAVKITGPFGYSTDTPYEIEQACITQVVRWLKRGQQAYNETGAIIELGQLRYTQQLDPDVKQILSIPRFQKVTI